MDVAAFLERFIGTPYAVLDVARKSLLSNDLAIRIYYCWGASVAK
jgi:hypothetical protein